MYVCMYVGMYVCRHVCMYNYVYVCLCIYINVCMCMCVCVGIMCAHIDNSKHMQTIKRFIYTKYCNRKRISTTILT